MERHTHVPATCVSTNSLSLKSFPAKRPRPTPSRKEGAMYTPQVVESMESMVRGSIADPIVARTASKLTKITSRL